MRELRDGELETALEMTGAVAAGDVTAVELTERSLVRADAWQPWTNAFSQLWADEALARAQEIDRTKPSGGLAGVPVTIKDLYDVAGHETTGCSKAYRGRVASTTAPVVDRVLAAGAIPIGKTNMHELAAGGTNLVSACGRTGNPWDPARMTGGSSGGAGVSVVTGIAPLALGSDTGGSVRIPASMCGTFGLKPTHGLLPLDGVLPLAPSMDCPGPLAATVADLRLLFDVMVGTHPTVRQDGDVRVTPVWGFFADDSSSEVLAAVDELLAVLRGARVLVGEPIGDDAESRGVLHEARHVWNRTCFPEFASAHGGIDRQLLAPQPRHWMERGEGYTPNELEDAARRREEIRRWFARRLETADALVVPTCAYPAPRADQPTVELSPGRSVEIDQIGPGWLTCSVNLAGFPAVSLPAATSLDGLPIGVSFIGRPNEEAALLALAERWANARGYEPRRPALPTGNPPSFGS